MTALTCGLLALLLLPFINPLAGRDTRTSEPRTSPRPAPPTPEDYMPGGGA